MEQFNGRYLYFKIITNEKKMKCSKAKFDKIFLN